MQVGGCQTLETKEANANVRPDENHVVGEQTGLYARKKRDGINRAIRRESYSPTPSEMPKKKKKRKEKTLQIEKSHFRHRVIFPLQTKPCTSYINMRVESKYFHGKKGRVVGHDLGGPLNVTHERTAAKKKGGSPDF